MTEMIRNFFNILPRDGENFKISIYNLFGESESMLI
jgi:hypothetical protein